MNTLSSSVDFKKALTEIVAKYQREEPEEYKTLLEVIAMKRAMTRDQYASIEGSSDTRPLFEMTETLRNRIVAGLPEAGLGWFATKEGAYWFIKAFPQFKLPNTI